MLEFRPIVLREGGKALISPFVPYISQRSASCDASGSCLFWLLPCPQDPSLSVDLR